MTNTLNKILHNGTEYLFPGSGPDYSWNTLTGTSFTLSGTNYRNLISTSSDTTVSVGTGLTPGMEYIIRITNSDSDNDHTMTFNSVAYIIPKSGTVTYKWLALTATTVEFEGPRYVYSMPATPEEGFIYYVIPNSVINYTITGSALKYSFTPSEGSDIQGCYISPDGTKMYIPFWSNKRLYQYSLSTPRDVSTATSVRYISVTTPDGIWFSDDGTKMFYCSETGNKILGHTLSTAWDISTATQDQSMTLQTKFAIQLSFSKNGKELYFLQDTLGVINRYTLSTAYDLSTAAANGTYTTSQNAGVSVKNNGEYMYIGYGNGNVKQYSLSTPYDISSTATEIGTFTISGNQDIARGLWVSNDGKYWVGVTGSSGTTVNIYQAVEMSS